MDSDKTDSQQGQPLMTAEKSMADEDPPSDQDWDAGLNRGLIFRPRQQKLASAAYKGPAKPAYYAESSPPIPYAKAILMAFVAIVPYFTILDSLGGTVDFTPCNNFTCHYMRIFNSKSIPGTGANVIGVQNGVERPIAVHPFDFESYTCEHSNRNRSFAAKVWGDEALVCPPRSNKSYTSFLHDSHMKSTREKVIVESSFAQHNFSATVKIAFLITKAPLWLFSWPMNLMAKFHTQWGMEHIPSSRCPKMSAEKMQQTCSDINVENKRYRRTKDWDHWKKNHPHITNHLRPYGFAKIGTYVGLLGSACFTALHDIGLLAGRSELETLTLGWLGILSYGMGAVCIFFWAMGASEVFVAQVPGHELSECACYYQMPELSALVALSTPFAMFVGFMTKVQMQGLASLFGDYLVFQSYLVPHYMGKQSFLWTWAVMTTPKMAGTIEGKPRKSFSNKEWGYLRLQQTFLYWCTVLLKGVVALVASSFMIAFKELCISLYMKHNMTAAAEFIIKWVLLPGPSVFALVMGCLAVNDLKDTTIRTEEGETFFSQIRNMCPCLAGLLTDNPKTKNHTAKVLPHLKTIETPLAWATFVIGATVIVAWTLAVAQGLCPDRNFLLGYEELTHPKVAQAELWGACGFVFFIVHVPAVLSIAFSTWDDMESLKHLENGAAQFDDKSGQYVINLNNNAGPYLPVNAAEPANSAAP